MSEDTIVALKGQVEALEGWRKQMLAVHAAADDRLRPLLKDVPGALGRHVYDVAADEILRLRASIQAHRAATPVSHPYNVRTADRTLWALVELQPSEDRPHG